MSQYQKIKAAVVGCGVISETYLKNITRLFHIVEIVYCADLIPERAEKRAGEYGLKIKTFNEILADDSIQIIINLTYITSHYEITKAALLAGKHVYSEKMIAVTLAEGRELAELAQSRNLLLCVAPDTFLGAGWQAARHAIETGYIGEPVTACCTCIRAGRDYSSIDTGRKRNNFFPGGGIAFDMGGYYLHNLINMFGPINRVCGFSRTRGATRSSINPRNPTFGEKYTVDSPNIMTCSLEFKNNLFASLTMTTDAAYVNKPVFELVGSEGSLTCFDPNLFNGELILYRRGCDPKPLPLLHGYAEECRGMGVAEMTYALKNKRKPRTHYELGLHAFEAVHGVIESCDTNTVYTMKSCCEKPAPVQIGQLPGDAQEHYLDD